MDTSWLHQLAQWREFFLLCGTAGGILAGVLFIVISLGPSLIAADKAASVRACVSPNVVHFTAVLVVSGALNAHALPRALTGWLMLIGAAATLLYLWSVRGRQAWHANGISAPDMVWYIALPYAAYALALLSGFGMVRGDPRGLPLAAAVAILLLVIGIRNAWDLAVWLPVQEYNARQGIANAGDAAAPREHPAAPGDT